jgi:hypothetical protein
MIYDTEIKVTRSKKLSKERPRRTSLDFKSENKPEGISSNNGLTPKQSDVSKK